MNVFSGKLDKSWVLAQNTFGVAPDILEEKSTDLDEIRCVQVPGINEPVRFVVLVILDYGSINIGCFKIQSDTSNQVEFKGSVAPQWKYAVQ